MAILALRTLLNPAPAQAQSGSSDFYIEPGVPSIRKPDGTAQVPGKLVINRITGDIYLGKFDFFKARP